MSALIDSTQLGFPWQTADPFLFCAYHHDYFPNGNGQSGPATSLAGRQIGQDFTIKDGWRMYHGETVPGFPCHPHRGFETITVVTKGLVDHADSLGAAGRYGYGDVQWMTAGSGVQHSEMFPLINEDRKNELELFQIWLNLPARSKMVEPDFKMFWSENVPLYETQDANGNSVNVKVIAGELEGLQPPLPPADSWAADKGNDVAVWIINLAAGATWQLPPAGSNLSRSLYFYAGQCLQVEGQQFKPEALLRLQSDQTATLINSSDQSASMLLLQGRPIEEPVAQHGPFVMNTESEIRQTFQDYQATQFGGWQWPRADQIHSGRDRFAKYPDGKEENHGIP
ncbi:MAG: redox-sensitive bicupin YhaK (pirin superfamily) [Parasphingorhabdus sp.]|jgi:redox-sensitive bicupin YhaK (pirin superfamily)